MLLFTVALMSASAAGPASAPPSDRSKSCPRTTNYYAWQRDQKLEPRKLSELPPATGYMAVYRQVGGCEAPMTVVEYRRPPRR